jgi:hypothetical protein
VALILQILVCENQEQIHSQTDLEQRLSLLYKCAPSLPPRSPPTANVNTVSVRE